MAKPKITRIKAGDSRKDEEEQAPITRKKVVVKDKKQEKIKAKENRKAERKAKKSEKAEGKKVFILFRPFVALFRYLRDSWREIRQVRWPNNKATPAIIPISPSTTNTKRSRPTLRSLNPRIIVRKE